VKDYINRAEELKEMLKPVSIDSRPQTMKQEADMGYHQRVDPFDELSECYEQVILS